MKFDLPKENSNIIKVLGVGGGGSNAVNHMFVQGINGVDFLVCNTDQQALDVSPVPLKIQLGSTLTEGRGAGSIAEVGKNAAIENIDEIKDVLSKSTKMVFITAGMGGGTGTGAAPVIAKTAREMGVLTVGIVTMPFFFEGRKRREQAEQGIQEIRENVDTLLIINNEKLREMCGNLPIAKAFAMADDVLTTAAKGIAEIITRTGYINVDFEDVRTVMSESGVAIMGSAQADGEDRAIKAAEKALSSPLLNDNNIEGARYVLLNIAFGDKEVLMDEISDITDFIQDEAGASADVIWGYGMDESLGDSLSVTLIATGFNQNPNTGVNLEKQVETRRMNLEEPTKPAPVQDTVEEVGEDEPFLLKRETAEEETHDEVEVTHSSPKQANIEFEITRHNLEDDADSESSENLEVETTAESEEPFMIQKDSEQTDELDTEQFSDMNSETEIESEPINQAPSRFSLQGSIENTDENKSQVEVNEAQEPQKSADQPKEWEPFIRSSESKPIVNETPTFKTTTPEPSSNQQNLNETNREEQSKRTSDRLNRLRDLSMKLRTPSGMSDLENEPAFKRKQINLDDVPSSAENNASRFTLSEEEGEDGEKKTRLRPNNPFLHDNVD
jgi:cell division protein FtsZ